MKTGRLALGALVLAAFIPQPTARACECAARPDPARALAEAALVFEGEALSVGPSRYANRDCGGFCPETLVRFRVARSWKGSPGREVEIYTSRFCGYQFSAGTTYLVYAAGVASNGPYHTSICSRTTEIGAAAEDLRVLGRGVRRE